MSTLSFFYSHQLSAIEGGAVLTDDPKLAGILRLLRNHGNSGWGSPEFDRSYNFVLFGYNTRPIELHCAIGRAQLEKLDHFILERRKNLNYFCHLVEKLPVVLPKFEGHPSPFGLHFQVESRALREKLVRAFRENGIDARLPTGGSFLRHPYGTRWRTQKTPVADRIHETGLFIGNAPFPIESLLERAAKVMRETL